jgi:TRAP-type C4-dicarboxylate transport system substrate-binding protein
MQIEIVDVIYLGTRQLNLRAAREVRGPADLSGVRLRMPPGPGWVALARGLGATPTPMPNPEVYLALRSGAIDGQENPLGLMRANNFHEVTQQIVLTSHLVQPVFFAFAKPWWDRLNARQQEVLRARAREAGAWNDENRLREEAEIVSFLRGAGLRVADTDRAAFQRSVEAQYRDSGIAARWAPGLAQRIVEAT